MHNNTPNLKNRRKHLRNYSTPAEIELWKYLKGKKAFNLKFRRQHSFDQYILDLYCPELHLAIELDGEYHIYNEEYDMKREQYLLMHEITIFRYENLMVFEHPQVILDDIYAYYKNFQKDK